MLEEAKTPR